jgi:hypothetical protein
MFNNKALFISFKMSDNDDLSGDESPSSKSPIQQKKGSKTNSVKSARSFSAPDSLFVDGDDDNDPFDRLERLILLHSSSAKKRGKTSRSSPDVPSSDDLECKKKLNRDFTPPVLRFGPVPASSPDTTAKFGVSTASSSSVTTAFN